MACCQTDAKFWNKQTNRIKIFVFGSGGHDRVSHRHLFMQMTHSCAVIAPIYANVVASCSKSSQPHNDQLFFEGLYLATAEVIIEVLGPKHAQQVRPLYHHILLLAAHPLNHENESNCGSLGLKPSTHEVSRYRLPALLCIKASYTLVSLGNTTILKI